MAHQAHDIPWKLLAANLEYTVENNGITNLYPRGSSHQSRKLNHFLDSFSKTIAEHSESERRKYPEVYGVPAPEEIVLSEDTVRKISPTVYRYRQFDQYYQSRVVRKVRNVVCSHPPGHPDCHCPVSVEDRKMSSFIIDPCTGECFQFYQTNERSFYSLELVNTLLLHNQMDPILRICSHPERRYLSWWSERQCECMEDPDVGWGVLCKKALMTYICLNTLYCYPELWDPVSGRNTERDYRRTRCYQWMLRNSTECNDTSKLIYFPHMRFFGVPDDESRAWWKSKKWGRVGESHVEKNKYPYGLLSVDQFLSIEKTMPYLPHSSDVSKVRLMLLKKGLPLELALNVMKFGDYTPQRSLKKPYDPLHAENAEELRAYLKDCWQLLVGCDMMARALKDRIPWETLVAECIIALWDDPHKGKPLTCKKGSFAAMEGEREPSRIAGAEYYACRFV